MRDGISADVERRVCARDKCCIYCGTQFVNPPVTRGASPSWEHIVDDASHVTLHNIALCCVSCNASNGIKSPQDWSQSAYCRRRHISLHSLAKVAQSTLVGTQTVGVADRTP